MSRLKLVKCRDCDIFIEEPMILCGSDYKKTDPELDRLCKHFIPIPTGW
jgi:hypothetical protein